MKNLLTIFLFISLSYNITANENCSFYLQQEIFRGCLEKKNDSSDYLTHYGYYYCKKFENIENQTKEKKFKIFIKNTRSCLQDFLENKKPSSMTCVSLENHAFSSHPICYNKGGYCKLNKKERLEVLSTLLGINILFKIKKSLLQLLEVIRKCLGSKEYAGILETFKIISDDSENLKELSMKKIKKIFFSIPETSKKIVHFFIRSVSILKYGQSTDELDKLSAACLEVQYKRDPSLKCFTNPTEKLFKDQNIEYSSKDIHMAKKLMNQPSTQNDDINIKLDKISKLR